MKIIDENHINLLDSMYPTSVGLLDERMQAARIEHRSTTVFGYAVSKSGARNGEVIALLKVDPSNVTSYRELRAGEAFSFPINSRVSTDPVIELLDDADIRKDAAVLLVMRLGYLGQQAFGVALERKGRLSYIDGCSDSLLIYPPRRGDPSLNHLHFPPGIEQSVHIHPSFRVGLIVAGSGYASTYNGDKEERVELKPGMLWYIEEMEHHRFVTTGSSMDVIAFHPDGDWGPEDHNHAMLNRTYLKKGA